MAANVNTVHYPPASADATSVITLSPGRARPGASPRSRCRSTSCGRPKCRRSVAGRIRPALLTRRWSSKAIWMRSGWLSGSIFWVLPVSGWISLSKTIIPDAQEHFLTPSPRRDTQLFGGLRFSNTTTALVKQCAHRQVRVPYGLVVGAVGGARTSSVPSDDPVPFRAVVALHRKRGLPCLRVGMAALILVDV